MRVGNVEGTPQEIRDLFEIHNLQIADYIEAPPQRSHWAWVLLPSLPLAILIAVTLFTAGQSGGTTLTLIVACGAVVIWLGATVHKCFQNTFVTWLVLIGSFILVLLAAGVLLPVEVLDWLKGQKPS